MCITGSDVVGAIKFQQDVFVVVDEAGHVGGWSLGYPLFHPPSQAVIFVVGHRPIADYSYKLVLCVVLIGRKSAA